MKIVSIYTDGACSGNQNKRNAGGWGAVLEYGGHQKEFSGGEKDTTNNRMELTALLSALQALTQQGLTLRVFSDSAYLINCFREGWYRNWQQNGWKTSKKSPVENQDLWEGILELLPQHSVEFYKIKGHLNLKQKPEKLEKFYEDFAEWNGDGFSMEEFLHIAEMNIRADHLATAACPREDGEADEAEDIEFEG